MTPEQTHDEERNCNVCGRPVMYGDRHSRCGAAVMAAVAEEREANARLNSPNFKGGREMADQEQTLTWLNDEGPKKLLQAQADELERLREVVKDLQSINAEWVANLAKELAASQAREEKLRAEADAIALHAEKMMHRAMLMRCAAELMQAEAKPEGAKK